jgi:predicted esterase
MMPVAYLVMAAALFASTQAHGPWGVAFAPRDASAPRPAIVYLHGMWASPEDSCATFEPGATAFGFLVCPRGNAPMEGGRMWSGGWADAARQVHAALDAAQSMAPGKLDASGGGTLIGYSNGAWFAVQGALAEPHRWTGLVLLSMKVDLEVAKLRAAGVERVLLGAGDKDMARAAMEATARATDAAGLPARFVSLGSGGHAFPDDMSERMRAAIAWVRGQTSPPE